ERGTFAKAPRRRFHRTAGAAPSRYARSIPGYWWAVNGSPVQIRPPDHDPAFVLGQAKQLSTARGARWRCTPHPAPGFLVGLTLQPEESTRCNMRMNAFDRGKVERFATLPPGEAYPEGIDADAEGNVYVVTVGANKPDTSPGSLFVFDPNGKLLRTLHTEGTSPWLLDLRFQPDTGKLLVVDYQNPKVFAVDP